MAIRENREYRNFPMMEVRAEGENPTYKVEGYASTFETYTLFESDGIEYKERILPEAFDDCDFSDVIFLKDHEGTVFARTKNNTLSLEVNDNGLFTRADLSKTSTLILYGNSPLYSLNVITVSSSDKVYSNTS